MSIHTAVWLDHKEAHIFHFAALPLRASAEEVTVPAPQHRIHRHQLSRSGEAVEHPDDLKRYFTEVAGHLRDAHAILIMGPGSAKAELVKHLRAHNATLADRVVRVEAVDHPTDPQIAAIARTVFAQTDRMS